jgi:hypothetical protein
MRSELIFGAMAYISNRFLLSNMTAKATRKFHRPNTRIQDTTNDVFVRFSRANPIAGARYTNNLQPFPRATQTGILSLRKDPEQSVA